MVLVLVDVSSVDAEYIELTPAGSDVKLTTGE